MKRKFLSFFSGFQFAAVLFLLLFSIISVAFVVAGYFINNISPLSYAYLLMGELLMPIEFLINRGLGKFLGSNLNIIIIAGGLVVAVVSFLALRAISATKKKRNIGEKAKFKQTAIFSLLLTGYFAFNLVMLILNYSAINKYLYKNINGIVEVMTDYVGIELIVLKCIVFSAIIVFFSFMTFIFILACREKYEKTKITNTYVNFYSDQYLQIKNNENALARTQIQEKVETVQIPKKRTKKASQDLITRIMQLNELKDTGQISDVEYTKLRQKAIKRYKV